MERQEYLQFFINSKKKPSSMTIYNTHNASKISRSMHHNGSKTVKKILPHIAEEYQYKITNKLLVHKIMNPKRDKLITENFQKPPSRPSTKGRKIRGGASFRRQNQIKSLDANRTYDDQDQGPTSLLSRIKQKQNLSQHKTKTGMKSYSKEFELALQNERMGRRILNTKSSVEEILKKTFYTYKSHSRSKQHEKENYQPDMKGSFIRGRENNKIYFSGKINNGVKVFFNRVKNDENRSISRSQSLNQSEMSPASNSRVINEETDSQSSLESNYIRNSTRAAKTSTNMRTHIIKRLQNETESSKHIETNFPQSFKIFGRGPTILMLYDIEIVSNPPLKDDSMLILELITHEKRIKLKKTKEKSIRTMPIPYEFIRPSFESETPNCIRFAINVSEIGDFVPLRIYKVHGVQIQQLGIIDVDLAAFRYRKAQNDEGQNYRMVKEYKIGRFGQKMERDIISESANGNLRKNLLNKPVETSVSLNYKIYPRKFKPVDERRV